jgi:hypothetical protein
LLNWSLHEEKTLLELAILLAFVALFVLSWELIAG